MSILLSDPPENMRLGPDNDTYNPGDTITCHADGNPELRMDNDDYQWINIDDTNDVTKGPVLNITNNMARGNFTYQCQACNEYLGQRHCATIDTRFFVQGKSELLLYMQFSHVTYSYKSVI